MSEERGWVEETFQGICKWCADSATKVSTIMNQASAGNNASKGGNRMKINLNTLARDITLREGLKESVSIAQVKEILKITFEELSGYYPSEVLRVIEKYERS